MLFRSQREVCIVIGGVTPHILLIWSYFLTYRIMFWIIVVIMGLIHCGFGVCLILTHITWMFLKLGLPFIYIDVFQYIMWFVPMLIL